MGISSLRDGMGSGLLKIVLSGFLLTAVAGLTLMGVGGMFKNGSPSNPVLAKVGNQSITAQELQFAMRPLLEKTGISVEQAYQMGAVHGVLDHLINTNLVRAAAKDAGILVDEGEVAQWIISQAPKGSDPETVLKSAIKAAGGDADRLIEEVGSDMAVNILGQALTSEMVTKPPQPLVRAMFMSANEKRNFAIVEFPYASYEPNMKAPDDALYALYAARKNIDFAIPEKRTFEVAEIKGANEEDADIDAMVAHADDLDQALLEGKNPRDLQESIGLEIKEIDFIDAQGDGDGAKDLSSNYGASSTQLLDIAFALEKGQSSSVIELPNARFVVVSLTNLQERSYKTFEEVRPQLVAQWEDDQRKAIASDKTAAALKEITSGKKTLAEVGKIKKINGLSVNDPALPLPLIPEVLDDIFKAKLGDYIIIKLPNSLAIVHVREISLPGSKAMTQAALAPIAADLQNQIARENLSLFVAHLREVKGVKIYSKRIARLYSSPLESKQ